MPTRDAVKAICTFTDWPTGTLEGMLARLMIWNAPESSPPTEGSSAIEKANGENVSGTVPVLVMVSVWAGLDPAPPDEPD